MSDLGKTFSDIGRLWDVYGEAYLKGIQNTLILAAVATLIGCIIGLVCGVLNTIPYSKRDPLAKRILLRMIRAIVRIYVEVFRGTPMVLQAVFIFYGFGFTYATADVWTAAPLTSLTCEEVRVILAPYKLASVGVDIHVDNLWVEVLHS